MIIVDPIGTLSDHKRNVSITILSLFLHFLWIFQIEECICGLLIVIMNESLEIQTVHNEVMRDRLWNIFHLVSVLEHFGLNFLFAD